MDGINMIIEGTERAEYEIIDLLDMGTETELYCQILGQYE